MAKPTYIKKEDVSTDNIYKYEYADGAFSGYWLKFKFVYVPMDDEDPFNPVQNKNAYAIYDAYIFENEVRAVTKLINSILRDKTVDFFYVEESVYQAIASDEPQTLEDYKLIPYQITDKIMTVNKYYLPADFDIKDYEQDPDEPVEIVYVTPDRSYNMKIGDKFRGILYGISITGHVSGDTLPDDGTSLGIFYAKDFTNDVTYCEMSASTSGNPAIDLSLRCEWVGHFPLGDITDWREDNTIEMSLVSYANEVPGKVRIYPHFYINGQEQSNYIDNASSEENPLYGYIEFDVTTGTEELENWIAGFQNNVYLYQMDKPGTDTDYIILGLEWSISDLIIHYTEGTSISDLGEVQQLNLTATDDKTFSDGTNTYNLQPMENLITGK